MAQEEKAIDIGHEMAELLVQWRPEMNGEDVARAVMHALERYSMSLEGSGESGIRSCLFNLKDMVESRIRSL